MPGLGCLGWGQGNFWNQSPGSTKGQPCSLKFPLCACCLPTEQVLNYFFEMVKFEAASFFPESRVHQQNLQDIEGSQRPHLSTLCYLMLAQAGLIWEEGASAEQMPPSDRPIGKSVGHRLDD